MSYLCVRVRSRSLHRGPEVRSGRRADDPLRILLEHQAVGHELPRGAADRVDVLLSRAVPLLERGPRVVRGASLGLRLRERHVAAVEIAALALHEALRAQVPADRKSTRLNSSHGSISYAVFCLKKKNNHLAQKETCIERKAT